MAISNSIAAGHDVLLKTEGRGDERGADAQPSLFIKFVEHRAEMLGDYGVG